MESKESKETFAFNADINELLNVIINKLYQNANVAIRELVSNASDALTKVKHLGIDDPSYLADSSVFDIYIVPNETNKTVTIYDTGVGMTKSDLVNYLSCIAKSGTKAFANALQDKLSTINTTTANNLNTIGMFGLGFMSAFLIADKVELVTKHPHDTMWKWESTANGTYSIEPTQDEELKRGTKVILHLKEDKQEYLNDSKLRDIVNEYSSFIDYPIFLHTKRTKQKEVEIEEQEEEQKQEEQEEETNKVETVETVETEQQPKKKTKMVDEVYYENERLNNQPPIWTQSKTELKPEDYNGFYKNIFSDNSDSLAYHHDLVEGRYTYTTLLYIPKLAPFDMFDKNNLKSKIKLYVKRVFIMDDSEKLLPPYLNFVKGIVDSEDLPLNVSREVLQEHKLLEVINRRIVKNTLTMLENLKEDDYKEFYGEYSKSIKLAVHEEKDQKCKKQFIDLLRYNSLKSEDKLISLKDYVDNMKEGQKDIYYIAGCSVKSVKLSPFLEKLKAKDYDVLFMVDPIDEYVMQNLRDYNDKQIVCVTKEGFKLDENEEDETDSFKPLCDFIKDTLKSEVEKVILTNKLENTPCVLSTSEYGWTANMQRIVKNQALNSNNKMAPFMFGRKIMEINPKHPWIRNMKDTYDSNKEDMGNTKDDLTNDINILYGLALLSSGFELDNPNSFAARFEKVIAKARGFDFKNDNYIQKPEETVKNPLSMLSNEPQEEE